MPLPASETPWPPKHLAPQLADVTTHAAWYAGDRTALARAYGRLSTETTRPSERRGIDRLWFWGRSRDLTQRETRLHVPLAADIATTSADLLFSEPPSFTLDETTAQDRLNEIVDQSGLVNTLLESAEVSAALGGVYLKVDWDASVAQHPFLAAVHADAAVPEFRWGQLVAVTFWREVRNDGAVVFRYLERHEPGRIEFGLYQGTKDNLGRVVPLTDRDAPDWVRQIADGLSEDGNAKPTGMDRLTAAYVPNMRPNRRWRGSDLGRSDYQGVEDLFDALDETWTSWMRDIRLGKGRLVVPQGYLQNMGKGQGAWFDEDREVYSGLDMAPQQAQGAGITINQFQIRVEEHARTADELVSRAVAVAGYSGQTFGLAGDVAATATEVTARERKSFITRDKKTRYWKPPLAGLIEVLLAVDRAQGWSQVSPARPDVSFGDSVSEDPKRTAETLELLERAKAASTETKVRLAHPEWDDADVADEVSRIQAEQGAAVPDPFAAAGLPGGGDPA